MARGTVSEISEKLLQFLSHVPSMSLFFYERHSVCYQDEGRLEGGIKKEPPSLPLQWFVPFLAKIQNGRMLNYIMPSLDRTKFLS
ncbi:hypothetical protein CDAR_47151 [Caerostris darwini]|uniref:Uncharacterized protein n=1 Tax=Caerostris darwini TaxID=1538125 RepID=A0AAV4UA73_9ARAC|nr:hypothetical protein CDAR_47151 [Caerostris darwini]